MVTPIVFAAFALLAESSPPVSLERYHLRPRVSVSLNCSSFTAVDDI
jgi:hypothetical protein